MNKTELDIYKEAFNRAIGVMESAARQVRNKVGCEYIAAAMTDDAASILSMVKPPEALEDAERVRWELVGENSQCMGVYLTEEDADNALRNRGYQKIKLTGICKVAKPPKVERSVDIPNIIVTHNGQLGFHGGTPHFKGTAACGKNVTLTAHWTE